MNVAFTLCSNNYLAHAKTLADSYIKHHPGHRFVVGLVDKISSEIDFSEWVGIDVIEVHTINIPDLVVLNQQYNITEFNTSVKPDFFKYLFRAYNANKVVYIDPDILVCGYFAEVFSLLDDKNIVITPHICSPIDDEFAPTDYHTLRGGVFNLGFIALSDYDKVASFLDWWGDRVRKYGFANFSKNMFYDQLWINYVPAFYDNYVILKHPGYNMANWNLHERVLNQMEDGDYRVNEIFPLRFFHFSSYKFQNPHNICAYLTRYDFESRPDLRNLFHEYHALLEKNDVLRISRLPVFYYPGLGKPKAPSKEKLPLAGKIANRLKNTLKVLLYGKF